MADNSKTTHFNDWPNSIGFDTHYEEKTPVELKVEGTIPSYAAGTLFRTGLGPRTVETASNGTFKVNHWFDNFCQVHRFQIQSTNSAQPPRVIYNSRLVTDGLIEKIRNTGKLDSITFAAKYEPCKTFFQKLQSTFRSEPELAPNEANIGVTISTNFPGLSKTGKKLEETQNRNGVNTLCTKTDVSQLQFLDPETLEPLGLASQSILNPKLTGVMSASHAKSDPGTGDVYNYNLDLKHTGIYRVFRVSAETGEASVLATFNDSPAYLHSLFLSENYVILCIWNVHYRAGGIPILWNKNLLDAMVWNPNQPAKWYVIDKKPVEDGGRGLVAVYESEPFFCFHTINAYEEKSKDGKTVDIVADLAAYDNMDVLNRFYLDNVMSDSPTAKSWSDSSNTSVRPTYRRYRLPAVPSQVSKNRMKAVSEFVAKRDDTPELPTLNPHYFTKRQRFVYGMSDSGKSTFMDSIVKYDNTTHTVKRWCVHGQTAGEPIFVADPDSPDEDGGVLLSVVLDGIMGKSYLLVLDARTMEEVGRAHVDGVIGLGFHGTHVKSNKNVGIVNRLDF